MSDLPIRIADQFSDRGDRADVWRALDLVVPTDRYLNLGYSPRFGSHLVGNPQRRLVEHVLDRLAAATPGDERGRLLDVGCGRGGPAALAARRGYDVIGVDLVPYNLACAFAGRPARNPPSFAVGDATSLPLRSDGVDAAMAVDALVYVPEKAAAFGELARVLGDGRPAVVTDLVAATGADDEALDAFAAAWDMPPPPTLDDYLAAVAAGGLTVGDVSDLSAHSVDRLGAWTRLFLGVAESPAGGLVRGWLARRGVSHDAVVRQVRAAHAALPDLEHVAVTVRA